MLETCHLKVTKWPCAYTFTIVSSGLQQQDCPSSAQAPRRLPESQGVLEMFVLAHPSTPPVSPSNGGMCLISKAFFLRDKHGKGCMFKHLPASSLPRFLWEGSTHSITTCSIQNHKKIYSKSQTSS